MTGDIRQYFATLEASLKELPQQLGVRPKALLVVSGHWEDDDFAVMSSPAPPMLYDYGGFPPEMYAIRYSAPGSPELAQRAHELIQQAGLATHLDPQRGFDHGTYSLLAVTHPNAESPVFQVSLRHDYDPEAHWKLGRALAPLRDEGVVIIGSGSSYHNLRSMLSNYSGNQRGQESAQFDAWLQKTLTERSPEQRCQQLLDWDRAPYARAVHPREDHFLPLHVALGAAEQEPARVIYHQNDFFGDITMSSYRFGEPRANGR
jgi:aromatic ring-opening dioxygenase catalytic subunit (LigB family)